jgi:transitional endoplasmic reticulum ATPase
MAARGRGYAHAAKSFCDNENRAKAVEAYRKSAKCFQTAAQSAPSAKEAESCKAMSQHFEAMASNLCTPLRKTHTLSSGEDTERIIINPTSSNIKFADIGGLESTKRQIQNMIIHPFTHPEIYDFYQINAGGGILLHGSPGCGKTMIAKATAGECDAKFYNVKTSDIVSRYVGEAEKQIREVFEQARQEEKAIIFFDEIDSIASNRASAEPFAKRVVNELLAQMDGVDSDCSNILVMAATNMFDILDPALLRHGRFGRHIYIPLPDQIGRAAILKIHTKKRPVASDVDIEELALLTEGYSGADISALCENAAYIPLQETLQTGKRRKITHDDFIMALDMQEEQ